MQSLRLSFRSRVLNSLFLMLSKVPQRHRGLRCVKFPHLPPDKEHYTVNHAGELQQMLKRKRVARQLSLRYSCAAVPNNNVQLLYCIINGNRVILRINSRALAASHTPRTRTRAESASESQLRTSADSAHVAK